MNQTVKITITTLDDTVQFLQVVEGGIDMLKLSEILNTPPPPAPVKKKKRSDAGKPRAQKAYVSTQAPLTAPAQ